MSSTLPPIELRLDRRELEPGGDAVERDGTQLAFVAAATAGRC